ncbi:restriction endonuclease [Halorubrum salinum]|uniref:restriction endonuclease n=1 Tax=Halorubrum salinum TaxID=767517 RepID=UPI002111AF43|nr:restriction endonuclease [Halorubrum salinum]
MNDDDGAVFFSPTRRDVLTATAALTATGGNVTTATAQSDDSASEYEIGLPLEQQWTFGFADSQAVGGPRVSPGSQVGDTYYLKLEETEFDPAKIVAYDIKDRSKRWELTARNYVSPPVVTDDTLVVSVLSDIKAYPAAEMATETLWEYTTDMDIVGDPAWARDGFLIHEYNATSRDSGPSDYTYEDGRLTLLDSDGNQQWAVNGESFRSPYVEGDSIIHIAGSEYREGGDYTVTSGRVVSRDIETGNVEWKTPDIKVWNIRSTPFDLVVAHTRDDAIRGINANTGEEEWTVNVGPKVEDYDAGPTHLFVGTGDQIQAIEYATGEVAWTNTTIRPYDISHTGGLVFIGAYGGNFYALDPGTGEIVWEDSHPHGDGFIRYSDEDLYLFSHNWVSRYTGQRGKALTALGRARDTDGLGTATAAVANLLGRKNALSRAETAIENNRYQEAMTAVDSANQRKGAVEATATLLTGGAVYGGARTTGKRVQARRLESALDQLQDEYPIESGALAGLSPNAVLDQAQVAEESIQQSRFGPALRMLATQQDDYSSLIQTLESLHNVHTDLKTISSELESVAGELNTQQWRKEFEEQLTTDGTVEENTLTRCRQAISRTQQYTEVKDALPMGKIDLSRFDSSITTVQSTAETPATVDAYVQAGLESLTTYANSRRHLETYDLSPIRDQLNQALQSDPMKTDSGVPLFETLDSLLTAATEAEQARTDIDYSHTGFTADEVTASIRQALATIDVNEMQAIATNLQNLKRGVWKAEHLHAYSPYEFEHLIADLYSDLGYSTEVTEEGSDGGIDVVATDDGEKLIIQVKQYSPGNKIGRPTIQQTAGVRDQFGADKAVVVTSSNFTGTARDASQDYGDQMELIDGQTLREMLSHSRLAPPIQSQTGARSSQRNQRTQRGRSHSQSNGTSSSSHNHHTGSYCMVCEQYFQVELETVETPTGETVQCCPRCKQLINEATGVNEYDRADALDVLDLSPGASDAEIKDAYRSLMTDVHPDQGGTREEFEEVQQAYETLL